MGGGQSDLLIAKINSTKKANKFKDERIKKAIKKQQLRDHKMLVQLGKKAKYDLLTSEEEEAASGNEQVDAQQEGSVDKRGKAALGLTHRGKNLEEMDDYKDRMDLSSEEEDNVPAEIVDKLHFLGDFDMENPENQEIIDQLAQQRKKSKKEIYEEIIKKSKKMKFLKQKQREEDEQKVNELNEGFTEFNKLLVYRKYARCLPAWNHAH